LLLLLLQGCGLPLLLQPSRGLLLLLVFFAQHLLVKHL
jgi:hypothetical protein